jgi:hypothetical protein
MALSVRGQQSEAQSYISNAGSGFEATVEEGDVVYAMYFIQDIGASPAAVTGLSVFPVLDDAGATNVPFAFVDVVDWTDTLGDVRSIVTIKANVTSTLAAAVVSSGLHTITGTPTFTGCDTAFVSGSCAWWVDSGSTTEPSAGGMASTTLDQISVETATAQVVLVLTPPTDGLMLGAGSGEGPFVDANVSALTGAFTNDTAEDAVNKFGDAGGNAWWAAQAAYTTGAGSAVSLTWDVATNDFPDDSIGVLQLGGFVLTPAGAAATPVSPDAQSVYERRRARSKALPYYLDTGLLKGFD